jgi:hypothetical protein
MGGGAPTLALRPRPEPDAGTGTPDFRPHRLNSDGVAVAATLPSIHATRRLQVVAQLRNARDQADKIGGGE